MTETDLSTRERLVITAATFFRQKGYHGTGLAEILESAKAPKGSLYHHFPDGKQDLALAAADWASQGMLRIIEDAFLPANDYRTGATTLCYKLAKFYDIAEGWNGCPVSHALFDGPLNETFRQKADQIFSAWTKAIADHGVRLGEAADQASDKAETLIMSIQGAWVLARARQSSDVLRHIPKRLFD
jgi:TetR/AcrR family transcriptional regulator, lmrAB and yxaGH operons repressor